ncbi:MAG TPA: hypothetical protein VL463_18320 [Kofleriaceae bacterium]|nr:hypothetical protein [Kofleriaceae bacterium]
MRTFFLLAVLLLARAAHADPTVLAVKGDDVFVDLGAADGATAGAQLRLLHVVIAKDPTSGQTLRDRFEVGTLTVARAGDHVLLAHPEDALRGKVVVGDEIALASAPVAYVDPWQQRVAAAAGTPAPATDDDAARTVDEADAARAVWQQTLGLAPAERIAKWEAYLSERPQSPYAAAVKAELVSLRAQAQQLDRAATARAAAASGSLDDDRTHQLALALADLIPSAARTGPLVDAAPTTALPGRPITLAFAIVSPARVARAWLYVRPRGKAGFEKLELAHDGDAYLRATIPASLVVAGGLEWFVEAASAKGEPEAVIGDQRSPRVIDTLEDISEAPIASGRSRVAARLEYVDFDGKLGGGHDQYYQAEFDFTYRFLQPVHAIRLGFGTLSGQGGPKDIIDADPTGQCLDASGTYSCRRVDFSYVYTEFELRPSKWVGLMLRPQAGLLTTDTRPMSSGRCRGGADTSDCDFGKGLGLRARVRFGEEDSTNLVLGVGFTSGVGTLIEALYQWAPRPVVPVTLAVQVTDQPVPEDFGVRIIGDVGWRGMSWVYPSVRVSYQARDIDHAGISGGLGLNFDW